MNAREAEVFQSAFVEIAAAVGALNPKCCPRGMTREQVLAQTRTELTRVARDMMDVWPDRKQRRTLKEHCRLT